MLYEKGLDVSILMKRNLIEQVCWKYLERGFFRWLIIVALLFKNDIQKVT